VVSVSLVVITRNEAPRLRLTLESFAAQDLRRQDGPPVELETVVVDDGSTDETAAVLSEFADRLRLRVVRHPESRGRSPSRNEGIRAAAHDVVILFDGDCLASPNLVVRHAEVHDRAAGVMGRGETFHLRCTRFFRDPEIGSPMPGSEDQVRRMGDEVRAALVTREQIRTQFDTIFARAEPGIYAGGGPRRLYELEMQALHGMPDASILWMTAPGQNFSLRRADLEAVGGFDERLSLNEHRELAFRLYERGRRMVPVDGARSFHMLHRVGWRDPLVDDYWERVFYSAHPCLATKLMTFFWMTLARDKDIPEEARIPSLEHFEHVVRKGSSVDYDALRRSHPRLCNLEVEPQLSK
jgi:glycosyltransferase involved in cell wall biosynthesis